MATINPGDEGSATSTAAAATINHNGGLITTEALATAAGADYAFTLTNANVTADCVPLITVGNGTNTTVPCYAHDVAVSAGQITFKVRNGHASAALNGTLKIWFGIL